MNSSKKGRRTSAERAINPEAYELTPFGRRRARGKLATTGMWLFATLRAPFSLIYRSITTRNHGV
jgi:hypothetical protein